MLPSSAMVSSPTEESLVSGGGEEDILPIFIFNSFPFDHTVGMAVQKNIDPGSVFDDF